MSLRRSFRPAKLDGLESRVVLSTVGLSPTIAHVGSHHAAIRQHAGGHQQTGNGQQQTGLVDQGIDQQPDAAHEKGLSLQQDGVRDQTLHLHGKK